MYAALAGAASPTRRDRRGHLVAGSEEASNAHAADGVTRPAVVVGVRLVWFFTVPYLVWAIDRRPAQRARRAGARGRLLVAWSGMRGAVSLAVALALPLTTAAGGPFLGRDLIVFLTFAVILVTLVGQGLSLPALIRRLQISQGDADADEELHARLVATKAALTQIDRSVAYQQMVRLVLAAQREALLGCDATASSPTRR
jgi:NhaP-type Na+/H+ or K+/H+ antiporter